MTPISLAFLCGILLLQVFSTLPSRNLVTVVLFSCLFLAWIKIRGFKLFIAAMLGFAWCIWYAHSIADFSLPAELEGKTLWVKGKVGSLPRVLPHQTTFLFYSDSLELEKHAQTFKTIIQLTWPTTKLNSTSGQQPSLRVGDEWLLPMRLKKIHGTLNPGGFDYEAWAFQNGIRVKGYVVATEKPIFIKSVYFSQLINRLRQFIQEKAQHYLPQSRTAPWLLALMIGERTGIPQSEWEVLRNTGTNHLMAIAGLHLGFMSGLAHTLTVRLWRRYPLWMLTIPAQQAGVFAALLMAVFYSALAGFSIPTQRALLMMATFLMSTLSRRVVPPWQAWSLALFIILLINPLSVLSASFWLSFTTLALLIYGMSGRLAPHSKWWKWGRPQWIIGLGLLPLSLWIFSQFSVLSFFANVLAIPCVGLLILPLCFLSTLGLLIFPPISQLTLLLADKILALLWSILLWLSQLPWAAWHQALPHYGYLIAATLGIIILLFPAGFPGKFLGVFWLLPLIFIKPSQLGLGDLKLTLLDVGQGLSVVIQTQNHVLVFDTGPRLSAEFDMGESVVLPFLRRQGIKHLDMLVISHGDNDHRGGAKALLEQLPITSIKTSVPWLFPQTKATYCLAGEAWIWDGVYFNFLNPAITQLNLGNDSSCVLHIKTEKKSILLTGDIEKSAEKFLLSQPIHDLSADILVAPHHGSKTSGLREFIGAVHPQYVLYAIGYRNRYHFPHPSVVQTYQEWGVVQYDTASGGAIQFTVTKNMLLPAELYRKSHQHYWSSTAPLSS